jgi:hypothetical protein
VGIRKRSWHGAWGQTITDRQKTIWGSPFCFGYIEILYKCAARTDGDKIRSHPFFPAQNAVVTEFLSRSACGLSNTTEQSGTPHIGVWTPSVSIFASCLVSSGVGAQSPATGDRTRDHLIVATVYCQMLYQLSYSRVVGCGRQWVPLGCEPRGDVSLTEDVWETHPKHS